MIVILHGIPGDDNRTTMYEIPEFKETIIVKVVPILGMELSNIISPGKPAKPVEQEFAYRFKFHDGKNYHYQFVSIS